MKFLDMILRLLPLNGDKTKVSAILLVLGLLKLFFPGLQIIQLLEEYILQIAGGGIVIGLAHKVRKSANV